MLRFMRKKNLHVFPALGLGLLACLAALIPISPVADPLYSLFLGFREPLRPSRELLILEAEAGKSLQPSRLAKDIEGLAEFGAKSLLVDIPVEWSATEASAASRLSSLRDLVGTEFSLVTDNVETFYQGLRSGSLRPADSGVQAESLLALIDASRDRLLAESAPLPDQGPALAAALGLARPDWLAVDLSPTPGPLTAEESTFINGSALAAGWGGLVFALPEIAGLRLPPLALAQAASGYGFSARLSVDPSLPAARFRAPSFSPLAAFEGAVLPHAALLLLADRLGASATTVGLEGLRLAGAHLANQEPTDLVLPLGRDGLLLIDKPSAENGQTRRLSLARLAEYRSAEASLVRAVRAVEKAGYLVERAPPSALWDRTVALEAELLTPGKEKAGQALGSWKEAKLSFFAAAEAAMAEKARIDSLCAGLLATPGLSTVAATGVQNLRDSADGAFTKVASALEATRALRSRLGEEIGGSICILGEEPRRGAGGFIPRGGGRPVDPAGEVADFLRAGLSGRFISAPSEEAAAGSAVLAVLILALGLLLMAPRVVLALGILAAAGFGAASGLLLVEAGLWLSPLVPALASIVPGLVALIIDVLAGRDA